MEQAVKAAARRAIARMSRMATVGETVADNDSNSGVAHYHSMLAQLALAQLALTYPQATLGRCQVDGAPCHFVAEEDGLYVRCSSDPTHGLRVA